MADIDLQSLADMSAWTTKFDLYSKPSPTLGQHTPLFEYALLCSHSAEYGGLILCPEQAIPQQHPMA